MRNPKIPDIPRARVVDAKQTRPSPVLERVWLRETKWTQRIPLLHTAAAVDDVFAQVEERVAGVAGLHPCREAREAVTTLHEHSLAGNAVEGIIELYF